MRLLCRLGWHQWVDWSIPEVIDWYEAAWGKGIGQTTHCIHCKKMRVMFVVKETSA